MKKEELLQTNEFYDKKKEDWEFYKAAYEGTKALIDWGVLRQFEDDIKNFKARKKAAFGFNYTKRIINIIADFLSEVPFLEEYGPLKNDPSWAAFLKDCDLYGSNWNNFWSHKRRKVSIFGHCGILVDKARGEFDNREEEVKNGIYPYLAYYSPLHILKWKIERDPKTNRPMLSYLKLYDDGGYVRIWTRTHWEVWKLPEKSDDEPKEIAAKTHDLKEIPFVWYTNGGVHSNISESISDIADIALIDASMVRDASNSDEIINNAAFPMLAMPKEVETEGGDNKEVQVGASRILDFDPDGAHPFWMESKVFDSISAIIRIWEKKSDEMYGMANLSALREIDKSKERRSGDSLKETFRFLNAELAEKVDCEIEARLLCIKYWMKWQGMEGQFDQVTVSHEKKFNAEKLVLTIKDAMESKDAVDSGTFNREIQKMIVKRILPNLTGEQMVQIDQEIVKGVKTTKKTKGIVPNASTTNGEDNE